MSLLRLDATPLSTSASRRRSASSLSELAALYCFVFLYIAYIAARGSGVFSLDQVIREWRARRGR